MSDPIKVGDLVIPVRGCSESCTCDGVGVPFRVTYMDSRLLACNESSFLGRRVQATDGAGDNRWPVEWLKKIPPLDELEGEKRREELTA